MSSSLAIRAGSCAGTAAARRARRARQLRSDLLRSVSSTAATPADCRAAASAGQPRRPPRDADGAVDDPARARSSRRARGRDAATRSSSPRATVLQLSAPTSRASPASTSIGRTIRSVSPRSVQGCATRPAATCQVTVECSYNARRGDGYLRIGELSRRVGGRRARSAPGSGAYALLEPIRSAAGSGSTRDDDVERVARDAVAPAQRRRRRGGGAARARGSRRRTTGEPPGRALASQVAERSSGSTTSAAPALRSTARSRRSAARPSPSMPSS